MAFFKDKQTGQVYEFIHEHDIKDMRRHPEYEEVIEEKKEEKKPEVKVSKKTD